MFDEQKLKKMLSTCNDWLELNPKQVSQNLKLTPENWKDWMIDIPIHNLNLYFKNNNFDISEKIKIRKYRRKLKNRLYAKTYRKKKKFLSSKNDTIKK
jgi:hypothetical protein